MICIQKGSIVQEKWPTSGPVDDVLVKSSCYLMEAAHSFRIFLKNHTQTKKPSKGNNTVQPTEKPNEATIWIAKTFPPWQSIVLTTLKQLHEVTEFCVK